MQIKKRNPGPLDPNPYVQLQQWLATCEAPEPNAATLSTVDPDGRPSARVILLKELNPLRFYTDLESRKAQALLSHPCATLTFYWPFPYRQVRIEGTVEKAPPEIATAYFQTRPRNSQIAAWASHQDQPLPSREALDMAFDHYETLYRGKSIPVPPKWGGFTLHPDRFEFWQGQPHRLHDRFLYLQTPNGWSIQRLNP